VSNGNLNDTSTTCGTIRALTCEPCYDLVGNGVAICETDETWNLDSECVVKGKACYIIKIRFRLNTNIS